MTLAFKSHLLLLKIFNINVWEITRNRSSNPACCYLAIQHKAEGFGVNFSGFTRNRIAFTKKTPVDRAHGPMDHYEMAVHGPIVDQRRRAPRGSPVQGLSGTTGLGFSPRLHKNGEGRSLVLTNGSDERWRDGDEEQMAAVKLDGKAFGASRGKARSGNERGGVKQH
jgi:hypothetical protein